jgi:hypothetical protein
LTRQGLHKVKQGGIPKTSHFINRFKQLQASIIVATTFGDDRPMLITQNWHDFRHFIQESKEKLDFFACRLHLAE